MTTEEEIEKEKASRKLEILRNDLIISTIFIVLIIFFIYESDHENNTPFKIRKCIFFSLFYIFLFTKFAINNFILNLTNNTRFVLFSTRAININGKDSSRFSQYLKILFSIWWTKKQNDSAIILKSKTVSNLLIIPILILIGISFIYTYSKEVF